MVVVQAKCVGMCWPGIVLGGKKWGERKSFRRCFGGEIDRTRCCIEKCEQKGGTKRIPRLLMWMTADGQI